MKLNKIYSEVSSWQGITSEPHRFGGIEFKIVKAELGHIHNFGLVDIPFTKKIRNQLIKEEMAQPHHILSDSGWISFHIKNEKDIEHAILLFRISYLRYLMNGKLQTNVDLLNEIGNLDVSDAMKEILKSRIQVQVQE